MGNKSSSNTRAYMMPKYTRGLTSSGTQRGLKTYLLGAFDHLCKKEKFNIHATIYNNRKVIGYMINVSYLDNRLTVLPLNRNVDILGCSKVFNQFLVFDKKKNERSVVDADIVLVDLVYSGLYPDVGKLLLKKLVKFRIISKSDARMIWHDLED